MCELHRRQLEEYEQEQVASEQDGLPARDKTYTETKMSGVIENGAANPSEWLIASNATEEQTVVYD
jgi:hypothetical protein